MITPIINVIIMRKKIYIRTNWVITILATSFLNYILFSMEIDRMSRYFVEKLKRFSFTISPLTIKNRNKYLLVNLHGGTSSLKNVTSVV